MCMDKQIRVSQHVFDVLGAKKRMLEELTGREYTYDDVIASMLLWYE